MTTSDWRSRMYPLPSRALSQQSTRLMQMLHTMPASLPTATSAQGESFCSESEPISTCFNGPYLHRVCWLLSSPDGYLRDICGTLLQWAAEANDVPEELRFATYFRAKDCWLALRDLLAPQDHSLTIRPVDFYAHRSSSHLWCACDG